MCIRDSFNIIGRNIIGRPVALVPWIMPPVIGAYLSTGGNIPAAVWAFCGLLISIAIYYPFFKIAEKMRMKEVEEAQKNLNQQ